MYLSPNEFENENEENDKVENVEEKENIDEPIYIMTLELEEEKFEQIKIFSNSDPDQLAYTFCKEHNLDFSAMEYLKEKIDNLIQKFKNKNDDSQIEEVESEINISESNNSTVKNSKIILNKKIENNNKLDNQNNNYLNKNDEFTFNNERNYNVNDDIDDNNNKNNEKKDINNEENDNKNNIEENSINNNEKDDDNNIHKRINNLIQSFQNKIPKAKEILGYGKENNNDEQKDNLKKVFNQNCIHKNLKISYSENKMNINHSNIKKNLLDSSNKKNNLNNKSPLNNLKTNFQNFSRELEIKRLIPHEKKIKTPNKNENEISTQISQTNNFNKNLSSSVHKYDNNNNKKYIENGNNILLSSYRKQLSQSKLDKIKKEYNDKYTFKPKINDNYKIDLNFNERQQFFTRLYKQKLLNKINNINNQENQLFTPNLLSKKINYFNHSNVDVYTKNYLYAKKYERNKIDLYNKFYNNENKFIQLGKESEKILQKKNDEIFSLIFKELDSDQDNYISPNLINTNNTPKKVLKIIEPLLNELIEDQQTLDENDFIQAMNKLYYNISNEDKYLINDFYRNKRGLNLRIYYCKIKQNNKKNIKPTINKKSKQLATIHDKKVEKKLNNYFINHKFNFSQLYLEKNNQIKTLSQNKSEFFQINKKKIFNNNYNHFSKISNYTFDNYVKNLN